MNRSLLLWALLVAFWDLNAQVPGYLGKRFTVEGNVVAGLTLDKWTKKHLDHNKYLEDVNTDVLPFALMTNYFLQLGYATSRKNQVNAIFGYLKAPSVVNSYSTFDDNLGISEPVNVLYNVKAFTLGLSWRFYLKKFGGIAPVGSYWSIGLTNTRYAGELVWLERPYIMSVTYGNPPSNSAIPNKISTSFFHMPIEYGRTVALHDRVLLNYGLRFAIPLFFTDLKLLNQQSGVDEAKIFYTDYVNKIDEDHEVRTLLTIYLGASYLF